MWRDAWRGAEAGGPAAVGGVVVWRERRGAVQRAKKKPGGGSSSPARGDQGRACRRSDAETRQATERKAAGDQKLERKKQEKVGDFGRTHVEILEKKGGQ